MSDCDAAQQKSRLQYFAPVAQVEEHPPCERERGFSINPCGSIFWEVAQLAEHSAVNRAVAGSSPAVPAKVRCTPLKVSVKAPIRFATYA
jgi:hypothetical protein